MGMHLQPARKRDSVDQNSRAMLLNSVRHLRSEIESIFTDAAHWNRINSDKEPIDPDPSGDLRASIESLDALLLNELLIQ